MYLLEIEKTKFEIPNECLKLLAMERAQELNLTVNLESKAKTIEFLTRLGIKVEEQNNVENN